MTDQDYPTVWLAEDGTVLVGHGTGHASVGTWSLKQYAEACGPLTQCRVVPVDVLRRIATAMRTSVQEQQDGIGTPESVDALLDCLAILATLTGDDDE